MPKRRAPAEAGAGTAGDSSSPSIPRREANVKETASELLKMYGPVWALHLVKVAGPKSKGREPGKRALETGWQRLPDTRRTTGIEPLAVAEEMARHLRKGGNIGIAVPEGVCVLGHDSKDAFQKALVRFPNAPAQESNSGGHTVHALPAGVMPVNRIKTKLDDGTVVDIRAKGSQFVVEPSVHRSGTRYGWVRALPFAPEDIPMLPQDLIRQLPLKTAGAVDTGPQEHKNTVSFSRPVLPKIIAVETEEGGRIECVTESLGSCVNPSDLQQQEVAQLEEAYEFTVPNHEGTRNRDIFRFASRVKAIPSLSGRQANELLLLVREWHRRALPNISTKAFDETWLDFQHAWPRAKPHGTGWNACVEKATSNPDPRAAEIAKAIAGHVNQAFSILVALCFELDSYHGGGCFPLSCRKAGEAIGRSHEIASRRIGLLVERGVLIKTHEGVQGENSSRAAEYRLNRNWPKSLPGVQAAIDS